MPPVEVETLKARIQGIFPKEKMPIRSILEVLLSLIKIPADTILVELMVK
jgi:hypothetical protein